MYVYRYFVYFGELFMNKKSKKAKRSPLKIFVFVLFFVYIGYTVITQQITINEKKAQLKNVNNSIVKAEEEKKSLDEEIKVVNTSDYIEKVARDELGYASPDEIVFVDATSQN